MSRQTYIDDTERLSPEAIEALDNCRENHEHGCPCVAGGDPMLREIVIEANEAEVAP